MENFLKVYQQTIWMNDVLPFLTVHDLLAITTTSTKLHKHVPVEIDFVEYGNSWSFDELSTEETHLQRIEAELWDQEFEWQEECERTEELRK